MISAIILAAGLSTRMGDNKLLLPMGEKSIIEHVVDKVSKSQVDEIIIVTGRDSEKINHVLQDYPYEKIMNKDYPLGQSTSVKVGLNSVDTLSEGALFIMGDQPLITSDAINVIIECFRNSEKSIVVPRHNGQRGNPVLFSSKWYEALTNVEGDKGGRTLIKEHPDCVEFIEISDQMFFNDVDDLEMYKLVREAYDKNNQ